MKVFDEVMLLSHTGKPPLRVVLTIAKPFHHPYAPSTQLCYEVMFPNGSVKAVDVEQVSPIVDYQCKWGVLE